MIHTAPGAVSLLGAPVARCLGTLAAGEPWPPAIAVVAAIATSAAIIHRTRARTDGPAIQILVDTLTGSLLSPY